MTTPHIRAIVSLAAVSVTLAFGGCARQHPNTAVDGPARSAWRATTIPFDNDGRQHVHVYLVSEQRQWLLGRVEPGAVAVLRVPEAVFAENPGFVRLAVIAGQVVTLQPAINPRAILSLSQPPGVILSQRWSFAQGQLTSLQLWRGVDGSVRR